MALFISGRTIISARHANKEIKAMSIIFDFNTVAPYCYSLVRNKWYHDKQALSTRRFAASTGLKAGSRHVLSEKKQPVTGFFC
jgi:hypothetical protein